MEKQYTCGKETTVATEQGLLRGFRLDEIYAFHGVKYAEAERFQLPVPVRPWKGVRDALSYGFVCPLLRQDVPMGEWMGPHRYWPTNEHCHFLNIWTQHPDRAAKRPVMVWLHGGGFEAGSSIEQMAYDGSALCREGDVVVVSMNHRLNLLGYLDLASCGEEFRHTGNLGNDDLLAGLKWIRENIEAFGGDADNVTLFGQSGGGMKVSALMQMPEAEGLFHKAIIQSGVIDQFYYTGDTSEAGERLLKQLHLKKEDAGQLKTLPYETLAEAYNAIVPGLARDGKYPGGGLIQNERYAGEPRKVGFTDFAKKIPVMVGTVFGEFAFGPSVERKYDMTEAEIEALLQDKYGDLAAPMEKEFRKAYPEKNLSDMLFTDGFFRPATIEYIQKRTESGCAPTYSYMFTYEFPKDGGRVAWHCSEIPFVFHNIDKVPICNTKGVTGKLEERMSRAWIAFAQNGNPNGGDLPEWAACQKGDEATMIFDRDCEVRHNFDHAYVELLVRTDPKMPEPPQEPEDETVFIH